MSFTYKLGESVNNGVKKVIINSEGSYILVIGEPFANCQTFTIGWFNLLLNKVTENKENLKDRIKEIKSLCYISKALLIIDVRRSVASEVKKILTVISEAKYESSNGSSMSVLVIDTRK